MPSYRLEGVCCKNIDFEIDTQGCVRDLKFTKGCSGNAQGIARLAEGRPAKEIIEMFAGIHCGEKTTSCPDQLAKILTQELELRG